MPTTEGQDENCQFVQIQNRTCSVLYYLLALQSSFLLNIYHQSNTYNLTGVVCFSIVLKFQFYDCHMIRLTGDDKEVQLVCAKAWAGWEMNTLRLIPDQEAIQKRLDNSDWALQFARIEW